MKTVKLTSVSITLILVSFFLTRVRPNLAQGNPQGIAFYRVPNLSAQARLNQFHDAEFKMAALELRWRLYNKRPISIRVH